MENKSEFYSNKRISSITTGPRQSNIELLRIIAMFLVLTVHADFWALGSPTYDDFLKSPFNTAFKTVVESISIVCVNVFVLISGWFGIKFSIKGLLNFLFQCAYFLFGIYIVMLLAGRADLTLKGIAGCFALTKVNWFIKSYIGIYILAPVLNIFIQYASKKLFTTVLVLFFVFQTIYGWSDAAPFIAQGYSTFSFIGLYLLAQYTRKYLLKDVTAWGGYIYIFSIVINSLMSYLLLRFGIPINVWSYVNPVVIIGSLGLLGFFWKIDLGSSKWINWIAKSSFAVFLLHSNPNIGVPIFKVTILNLYAAYSGIECVAMIFVFLISVFAVAILLDQPRKWLWRYMSRKKG